MITKGTKTSCAISAVVIWVLTGVSALAHGGVFTELFNFDCATNGCDPLQPALLAQGEDGVLYSTLETGTSQSADGTIIDYAPGGAFSTLYQFQGDDGLSPQSGFVLGFDGAFYGATTNGGPLRKGTVF